MLQKLFIPFCLNTGTSQLIRNIIFWRHYMKVQTSYIFVLFLAFPYYQILRGEGFWWKRSALLKQIICLLWNFESQSTISVVNSFFHNFPNGSYSCSLKEATILITPPVSIAVSGRVFFWSVNNEEFNKWTITFRSQCSGSAPDWGSWFFGCVNVNFLWVLTVPAKFCDFLVVSCCNQMARTRGF